ncbi:MAG: Clp protease [Micromonosporaceae bacterium]|nr:Clp protease [Micromonosporaceae bacterium]
MFERFTKQARQVVTSARDQARELGHHHVGTEHLLLALLDPDSGTPAALLAEAGLTSDGVRAEIERLLGQSGFLTPADAAALERIGIDIEAVRARIEESFGPGALEPEVPPTRYGLFGRKVSRGLLTPRTKKVLELALREAIRLKHNWIGSEHILLGLIREGEGLAAKIIVDAGVDLAGLRRATEESLRAAA